METGLFVATTFIVARRSLSAPAT